MIEDRAQLGLGERAERAGEFVEGHGRAADEAEVAAVSGAGVEHRGAVVQVERGDEAALESGAAHGVAPVDGACLRSIDSHAVVAL